MLFHYVNIHYSQVSGYSVELSQGLMLVHHTLWFDTLAHSQKLVSDKMNLLG